MDGEHVVLLAPHLGNKNKGTYWNNYHTQTSGCPNGR